VTCCENPGASLKVRKYLPNILGASTSEYFGRNNGCLGDDPASNDTVIGQYEENDEHA
jgi:hypothetical protein